jgi:tetratricopeptide (TPR) repeat protein
MFADWDHMHEEDDSLEVVKRYQDMLERQDTTFFDLYEYEFIIDHYIDQLRFKEAYIAVGHAMVQHPYSSSLKIRYIQLLIESGKPAKALGIIRTLGSSEASNYELYLAKGVALNITGKHEEAVADFEQAINLCSGNLEELIYNIAQSYIQIGNYPYAARYLQRAFSMNTDNVLVLYDLALTYEKLGYPAKSIDYYKKYLDLDPFAEHVWNNLGLLYSSVEDIDNALIAFDYAVVINPQYYSAYYNKADLYIFNNRMQDAIDVYKDLLQHDGSNTKALSDLGNCFEESGMFAEALKTYDQALAISSDCSEAHFGKGMVYFRQGRYRQSVAAFRKAVAQQSDNSDFWFMLGEALMGMKRLDQAISAYSKAAELNPFDFEAWLACAQILFRKKRVGEAIDMLIRLYQHNHENPTINYRLAAYHAYQLDMVNACRYFEKGLRLNFQEHMEMFRSYPKTKALQAFRKLLEDHRLKGNIVKKTQ